MRRWLTRILILPRHEPPKLLMHRTRRVVAAIMWASVAVFLTGLIAQVIDPGNILSALIGPSLLSGLAAAGLIGVLHIRGRRVICRHQWCLCPECHYDLRGCTSGICPECGREWTPEEVERLWRDAYQEVRAKRGEFG